MTSWMGCQTQPTEVADEIVSLGKIMGLEINNSNVEELVKEHNIELSIDELQLLQKEQQKDVVLQELSFEEDEEKKDACRVLINEIGAK